MCGFNRCPTCDSEDVAVLAYNPITDESALQCQECGEEWFEDDECAVTLFDDADYIYEDFYEAEDCLSEEQVRVLNGDNPESTNGAF